MPVREVTVYAYLDVHLWSVCHVLVVSSRTTLQPRSHPVSTDGNSPLRRNNQKPDLPVSRLANSPWPPPAHSVARFQSLGSERSLASQTVSSHPAQPPPPDSEQANCGSVVLTAWDDGVSFSWRHRGDAALPRQCHCNAASKYSHSDVSTDITFAGGAIALPPPAMLIQNQARSRPFFLTGPLVTPLGADISLCPRPRHPLRLGP